MSKFEVPSKFFKYNKLEIRPAGMFKGIRLYLDGQNVKLKRGKATVKDDNGVEREVKINPNVFDHLWVDIEGEKYYPMGMLTRMERLFVFMPLALIMIGGAIGGAVGAFATFTNTNLVREFKDSPIMKYGMCMVSTSLAVMIWFLGATMVHMIANR